MAESLSFPTWGTTDLDGLIDLEAAILSLPASVRDSFKHRLHIAYKPGGVGWTNPGQWTYYYAEGGYLSVPFTDSSGVITAREYTFGAFNYRFTLTANEVPGRNAMSDAELALVWDRVRAGLATWNHHVSGQLTPLVGAGCAGSNGTPFHQATGTPEVGQSVQYAVANTPPSTVAVAVFGFQNVMWNGTPLPINLIILGAPNCMLRIDPSILQSTLSTSGGTASYTLPFPNDPALIGAQVYSQFLVLDPPANTLGLTISNALRTTLGGWL